MFGLIRQSGKKKKCLVCKESFVKTRSIQPVCDKYDCKISYALLAAAKSKAKREVQDRKETRAKLEKLKTRQQWLKDAQASVNAYVRIRDRELPCISCGRFHKGQWHAGHYLSRGAHPELALDVRNIHKQCQPCNTHLSGNQLKYRQGLIERHGLEFVEWLDGPHEPKRYTIEDLKIITKEYRLKAMEIKSCEL